MSLIWTLPAQPNQTARWESPSGGGGGGSQDLAQVLVVGGDPEGNHVTGTLVVSPSDPSAGAVLAVVAGSGSDGVALKATGGGDAADGGAIAEFYSWDDFKVFSVASNGATQITGPVTVTTGGVVFPSADPHVAGAWWDNAGTLTRSTG